MLTSSTDAIFCNYNNHCKNCQNPWQIFFCSNFQTVDKVSQHTGHSQKMGTIVLVLNGKIKASEWHFTVYRSTFKLWHSLFGFFFFCFSSQWCTINVVYLCVATSENAIQLRWIPFSLNMNIELCTLMYLFTFCISFQSVGVTRWAGCKIDTVLNCTVMIGNVNKKLFEISWIQRLHQVFSLFLCDLT